MAKTSSLTKKPALHGKSSKKRKSDASAGSISILNSQDSASSDSDGISQLFEPYSKDHLIELITHAALKDPSVYAQITRTADNDVSLRQLFVYGLAWDTTQDSLRSAFQSFGEIENCTLIADKNTGNSKGYAFVLFKSRRGATKALKTPTMKFNNRVVHWQLASAGRTGPTSNNGAAGRKIYVSNVHSDVHPDNLRNFFAKFGQIETGPIGFDVHTGKARGYAMFVYKTNEGARKALVEPYKIFEGHQLHCRLAFDGKGKNQASIPAMLVQPQPQPSVLATMPTAQNLPWVGQHPSLNPAYGGQIPNLNPGFYMGGGSLNPAMVGESMNLGMLPTAQVGQMGGSVGAVGLNGYVGGSSGLGQVGSSGNSSGLGGYGSNAQSVKSSQFAYANVQLGQQVSGRIPGAGYHPYFCGHQTETNGCFLNLEDMNSSTQFISSIRMDVYEPMHHISMWGENFTTPPKMIIKPCSKFDNQSDDASFGSLRHPNFYVNIETTKPVDKVKRRLAQNREAARKSRLWKKAYIHQLETSCLELIQLEQELDKARQQGLYVGCRLDSNQLSSSGTVNSGVMTTFETEYGRWVEEQNRQICQFRTALPTDITDLELRIMVENGMRHYFNLFNMKARAAKADVFYVMNGMWKTSTERLFLWIGGSRPSELLKILAPQLDKLTKQQVVDIHHLQRSCKQAEEALLQGMEKLRQALIDVVAGQLAEGSHPLRMETAMERLEDLVSFVNQADHLRQESLQQMYKILTTRQSAQGLLVLGEYFQHLRALSSLSSNRLHDST